MRIERVFMVVFACLWLVGSIPIAINNTTSISAAIYLLTPVVAAIPFLLAGLHVVWEKHRNNVGPRTARAPSEGDFLSEFGVSPVESDPASGSWTYVFSGPGASSVRFSYNTQDAFVKVDVFSDSERIASIESRGVMKIWIMDDKRIRVVFHEYAGTLLTISVDPVALVEWSSPARPLYPPRRGIFQL